MKITTTSICSTLAALCALLITPLASAALYTVGPGGTHSSVQSAVSAAVFSSEDDEIRIAQGTYSEKVQLSLTGSQGLQISGGWTASFATSVADSSLTVISGSGSSRTFTAVLFDTAELSVSNLSMIDGFSSGGAGALLDASGSAQLRLERCTVRDNLAESIEGAGGGAGLLVSVSQSARIEVSDCDVVDNIARGISTAYGGGAAFTAQDEASLLIQRNSFRGNQLQPGNDQSTGAGLELSVLGNATVEVINNRIESNSAGSGATGALGIGAYLGVGFAGVGSGQLDFRGNVIRNNTYIGPVQFIQRSQVQFFATAAGGLTFGDNEVSHSSTGVTGVRANASNTATVHLVNLTVAHHDAPAITASRTSGAALTVYNSILFGNGSDTLSAAFSATGDNLLGVDPQFVSISDLRLRPTSPARDAGNTSPPGGLGAVDAQGSPRVNGPAVDMGAYEFEPPLFADGFE